MQFLVDPSSIPEVISCAQLHGDDIYNDIFNERKLVLGLVHVVSGYLGIWVSVWVTQKVCK